ncbi:activator-dependent family glycosyltransferase [Streptomyces sp. NPDC004111]|uniref:activator-dependent family glycosyltransferase n=1 Tax=Streptomyces sp. NPDC004111 TaxID=3364690 RepID=UPI0036B84621
MRVLLAVNPHKSVFQYLVPMMWALRTAGHEVRVASQPSFAETITQAGLTAVPVGRDHVRLLAGRAVADERAARGRAGIEAPYDAFDDPAKDDWAYLSAGMAETVRGRHHLANFPIVNDLVEFARQWRPDLVLWDPLSYAGAIAAKAVGAAHARLLFGIDVFGGVRQQYLRLKEQQPQGERVDPLADWLGSYARRYGGEYSEDMATGHFTVDQFPRSIQVQAPGLHYERMQWVGYGGPAVVPRWLWEEPERPRVALTMGLSATDVFSGYTIDTREVLDSLAGLDVEVVATVAAAEQERLGRVPSNVRMVPFVPMHVLAERCSAVIHHAGAATLATFARHPVPHLSLHYHFDQPVLARKLTEHGAGLDLHTSEVTGPLLRERLVRLLEEPSFARRAADLRDELLRLPTPNELVGRLEELTARFRTRALAA